MYSKTVNAMMNKQHYQMVLELGGYIILIVKWKIYSKNIRRRKLSFLDEDGTDIEWTEAGNNASASQWKINSLDHDLTNLITLFNQKIDKHYSWLDIYNELFI